MARTVKDDLQDFLRQCQGQASRAGKRGHYKGHKFVPATEGRQAKTCEYCGETITNELESMTKARLTED